MSLKKVLEQISNLSFLSFKSGFQYGSPGKHLTRNLESLWFQQCVTKPPHNMFLISADKFEDTLEYIKSARVDFFPFGLAALEHSKSKWNQWICEAYGHSNLMHKIGKVIIFSDINDVKDVFQVKQRERKIWWRKLAWEPSKFNSTEVRKTKNYDVVDIQAQFSFGSVIVESIKCYHDVQKLVSQELLKELDLREIKVVEHVTSFDWASLALLCDAYQERDGNISLQLHPKLTPYKVMFSETVINDDELTTKDLKELVLYLNNLLRTNGINTILTSSSENKKLQVPFVVDVDSSSLKTGIIRVKSQFTSLSESVHITGLIEHISSRCL